MKAKAVLQNWWESGALATGGGKTDQDMKAEVWDNEETDSLKRDLVVAMKRNRTMAWFVMLIIASLIITLIVVIVTQAGSEETMKWISSTSGGVAAFLVPLAVRFWREIARMEVILIIAGTLKGKALKEVLEKLMNSLP